VEGYSHWRPYDCRDNLEAMVTTRRISEDHLLAGKGMTGALVTEIRLFIHDGEPGSRSLDLYREIDRHIPSDWVAVMPILNDKREIAMLMAQGSRQITAAPPRTRR
jgi:hypothetical protein